MQTRSMTKAMATAPAPAPASSDTLVIVGKSGDSLIGRPSESSVKAKLNQPSQLAERYTCLKNQCWDTLSYELWREKIMLEAELGITKNLPYVKSITSQQSYEQKRARYAEVRKIPFYGLSSSEYYEEERLGKELSIPGFDDDK